MSVISYVAFELSLCIPYLSFFYRVGRAVFHECGISLVSSHIFLETTNTSMNRLERAPVLLKTKTNKQRINK